VVGKDFFEVPKLAPLEPVVREFRDRIVSLALNVDDHHPSPIPYGRSRHMGWHRSAAGDDRERTV
jgi:hypothetical protein